MMDYRRSIPPLNALLAVEAVARLRSFTRAAEELHISQSAVSHAVTQAESLLRVSLFDRRARPVALTAAGADYAATLSLCLSQLAAEARALEAVEAGDVLTISCNLAYGNYWLMPRLKAFHQVCPEIQVNMVTSFQGPATLDGNIDVAIRFGLGHWPGLRSQLLFREQILPVASPSWVAEHAPVRQPQDLLQHTFLHAHSVDKSWYDWRQWFAHFGVSLATPLSGPSFDNHLLMMQAALSGDGVALGWIGTASGFLQAGQLQRVFERPVEQENGLYVVHHLNSGPQTRRFVDWLIGHTRAEQASHTAAFLGER